jgi:hypothetical protein
MSAFVAYTKKKPAGRKDSNLRAGTGQRAVEVLKAKTKLSKQLIACYQSLANYTRRKKKTAGDSCLRSERRLTYDLT